MTYTAEIIGVGTELLLGNTVNTDARDISEALSELGINVYFHTVVGDNPERLKSAVDIAKSRADIIITTGGLGPTYDDLTKQTLAECFGRQLVYDEESGRIIKEYFEKLHAHSGGTMPENNLQQAMLPEDCTIFRNACGTAPGCAFEAEGKHVLMLPGPPTECEAMFKQCALPYLKKLSSSEILSHTIHIFGRGESSVEQQLRPLMQELDNPTLAPYAKSGEVMLRLTAKADSTQEAENLMAPVLERVKDELGDVIYAIDGVSLEGTVLTLLKQGGKTLATAESCTGGLLSGRITDIPGASQVFLGGVTSYSNSAKSVFLGVDSGLIDDLGAVSEGVARAMAEGVSEKLSADFGIGITGIAGPASDGSEKEVGTVFVAMKTPQGTRCRRLFLGSDRYRNRLMSVNYALDMLRRYLTGIEIPD